jgi:hypothetical protein
MKLNFKFVASRRTNQLGRNRIHIRTKLTSGIEIIRFRVLVRYSLGKLNGAGRNFYRRIRFTIERCYVGGYRAGYDALVSSVGRIDKALGILESHGADLELTAKMSRGEFWETGNYKYWEGCRGW